MITRRYSCCAPVLGVGSSTFDAAVYSAFKYGSHQALLYQASLINNLIESKLPEINPKDWALSSAAYKKVPTASTLLTWQLDIYKNHVDPIPFVHLERDYVYPEDYARLTKTERAQKLGRVALHFHLDDILGKRLIVVDDAYVTGAHEENIIKQVGPFVNEIVFIYLIDLSHCPLPDEEAKINMNAVKSLANLLQFIEEGNYQLNARTVKYLLAQKDLTEFTSFIYSMNPDFVYKLYKAAVADGYAKMKPFAENMRVVSQAVIDNPIYLINHVGYAYAGISA